MDDFRVCAYHSLDELETLRPAWDELLAQYPLTTTFCTWEWLASWWNIFGTSRQLLVLAFFDSFSLAGLAPLSISRERHGCFSFDVLRLMGTGSGDSDNLDFPVRPGLERPLAKQIIQYLKRRKDLWDLCLLDTLPPESLVAGCMTELFKSASWTVFEYSSTASAIKLPETWEQFTATLSNEDRKNLARYTRRLRARHRIRIHRCQDPDDLERCLEALFRLHQGRWQSAGQPGSFSSARRRQFYDRLSRRLLERGWLELWILELDAEIAAVQFAFRHGKRVFQLQEGYDHKRSADRPGYVLRGEVLKQLISERVRIYDFLGGEDPFKSRWGACAGRYRNLHFAPAFSLGAAWLQFADKTGRSKAWLRRKLPNSMWTGLRHMRNTISRNLRLRQSGILQSEFAPDSHFPPEQIGSER